MAKNLKVDLHMHSFYSDGDLSPKELACRAAEAGLDAAVLTDHDTDGGSAQFIAEARRLGLRTIRGIELSAAGDIHILAYGLPPIEEHPILRATMHPLREARWARLKAMVGRLQQAGCPITIEQLASMRTQAPTRAHLATLMKHCGFVPDRKTAFDLYIGRDKPCYLPLDEKTAEELVSMVTEVGGKAVLAHPGRLKMKQEEKTDLVARLTRCGLCGIEVYYITHTTEEINWGLSVTERFGLFRTNGSDFHRDGDTAVHGGGVEFLRNEMEEQTACALGL